MWDGNNTSNEKKKSVLYPFYWELGVTTVQTLDFLEKKCFFGLHLGENTKNVLSGKGKSTVPRRDHLPPL